MPRYTIAMDGPVGAGKSSVADEVARRLGILHLDTGAMYRAVGLACAEAGIDLQDEASAERIALESRVEVECGENGQRTFLNGRDVSTEIRTEQAGMGASAVSKYAGVRRAMVALQQRLAAGQDMLVDGRDICSVVLPDAPLKIFITASAEARAMRRFRQLQEKGASDTFEQVLEDLKQRDYQDSHRAVDPLRPTEDAVILDTTELDFEQTVQAVVKLAEEKCHE